MFITRQWPVCDDLGLTPELSKQLKSCLLDPFSNQEEAKAFWADCSTTLMVVHHHDCFESQHLSTELQQQLIFALTYSEFADQLPNGYQLSLAIVHDDGAGFYLLIPTKHPLIKELRHG
ncbi:hypothetical protein [Aliamphritea hakodatensis]|uniref:hypothetical protein n=1 Tax=Aliamphritea hakodatensis TaxID=2895352 RepID=UPI0022FD89EF|nr:hypothetical protein [Aliamphritea hakodatensis]